MYELYCRYARDVVFSARKSNQRMKWGSNIVVEKFFVCSSEGYRRKQPISVGGKKRKSVVDTRSGCKTGIKIKLNSDGLYEVGAYII